MVTLWFTDHAFHRFAELFPDHAKAVPTLGAYLITSPGVKPFLKAMKAIFKVLSGATRVTLPANKQWGKFLKHGVQDELLLCAKDWTTFVIVREGDNHTVVTITRPPKEKRDAEIDTSVDNPAGALYFKQVSSVVVPYGLAIGATSPNNGFVNAMHNFQVQVYFGRSDYGRKPQKLPLQPG